MPELLLEAMMNQKVVEKLRSIGAQPRKLLKDQISDLLKPGKSIAYNSPPLNEHGCTSLWKSKKAIGRSLTTKPQTSVPKSPMFTPQTSSKHEPAKLQTPTSEPQTPTSQIHTPTSLIQTPISQIQTPNCSPPRQPEMKTDLTSDCAEVDQLSSSDGSTRGLKASQLHVSCILPSIFSLTKKSLPI